MKLKLKIDSFIQKKLLDKTENKINRKQFKKSKITLFCPKKGQISWIWKYFIKCVIKSYNNQIKMKYIQLSSKDDCIRQISKNK